MALPPCMFSCRIVDIDFYTAAPVKGLDVCYSETRSSVVDKVPVVRIFGSTPMGQKTCLHIHGVFPYIYVPCLCPNPDERYLEQFASSIDHALQVSLGAASKAATHVFKIVAVKGIPFYGYHESEEPFLKIYLCNPTLIRRLSDLLLAGAIMSQVLQPHEAHIPFPLQFMMDYNLFGMNHIHLSVVKFRLGGEKSFLQGSPRQQSPVSPLTSPPLTLSPVFCSPSQTFWDVDNLPRNMVVCVPRVSVCELEADGLAADVLNREELSMASDGYPGLAAIWEEEKQRRLLLNNTTPLSPPPSPERGTAPLFPAEQRWRAELDNIVKERLGISSGSDLVEPPPTVHLTQSCDVELHRPVSREEGEMVARQLDHEGSLVDEEVVQQSMEMSQRFSEEAIRTSTDAELLDMMLGLCQTPDPQPSLQLSQSLYTSQTVAQSLAARMRRSHSAASSSLFSSPPGSYSGPVESTSKARSEEGVANKRSVGEAAGADILDTSIHSPASTLTSDDRLFDENMVDNPSTSMETLEGQDNVAKVSTAERDTQVFVSEASQLSDIESGFQLSLDVSPTEEQKQLVGIMEPNSPLSPAGMGMESRYVKEPDPLDSQFDIPCAQAPSTSQEVEKSLSPHDASNGLCSEVCSDVGSVQLDNISDLSLLEVSKNPVVSVLESPVIPTTSILGPDAFVLSQFGNILQIPPAQIPLSQRRKLLHLCSGEEGKREEGTESSASEEEEEESYWLSQQVWEDVGSPQQQSADSTVPLHQPLGETGGELWSTLLLDNIPQLDGSNDSPVAGRRRRRKTLGVKRRKKQRSLHTHQPPDLSPKSSTFDTLSEGDAVPPGSATTGPGSSDSEGTRVTAPKKARPSLSLKKKLSKDSAALQSSANLAMKDQPSCFTSHSLNTHPLVNMLKQQALTDSFRPRVKRLALSQVECLSKAKKTPSSSGNKTLKSGSGGKQLQKRRRKDCKGDGTRRAVPLGWSKHLRSRSVGCREGEELLLNLEWTAELEGYSYVEQLQAVIEESLKSPDGSATETTTDTTTADDTSWPLKGGEAGGDASSSTEGEEHHSSHKMDSQRGTAVDIVQVETSQDKLEVEEQRVPFDVEHCTVSPDDLEVTVVAESPTRSPGMELATESGSPKAGPSQKTPPLVRGVLASPLGAASSSPCSGLVEPIPVLEELKSLFDTVPLVDRVVCGVEGEVGIHDVSLTESDFRLALTASDTESEDAMRMDVEGEDMLEDVLEGLPDSSQWHSEVEPTSAGKTTEDEAPEEHSVLHIPPPGAVLEYTSIRRLSSPPASYKLGDTIVLKHAVSPPPAEQLTQTASSFSLPQALHIRPFYSDPSDVQPAKHVGSRVLRVPSRMAYDLHEFDPPYLTPVERFSTTGLEQMRTVLNVLSSVYPGTQPVLPPLCHPTRETKSLTHHYSAEDHKNDVELRATFFSNEKAVITPAVLPPHPLRAAAWYKRMRQSVTPSVSIPQTEGRVTDDVPEKQRTFTKDCSSQNLGESQVTLNMDLLTEMHTRTEGASVACMREVGDHMGPSSSAVEGSVLVSPTCSHSVLSSGSSGGYQEQSLTSYQPLQPISREFRIDKCVRSPSVDGALIHSSPDEPHPSSDLPSPLPHLHSTPMVTCECTGGNLEELTPVRAKDPEASKHSSENIKIPFTPLTHLKRDTSQLEGPTPNNTFGFKVSQSALPGSCDSHEVQYLTSMSVELHIRTRGSLRPDPECDPVLAIFYYIYNDWPAADSDRVENACIGVLAIDIDNCHFGSPVKGRRAGGETDTKGDKRKSPVKDIQKMKSPSKSPAKSLLDSKSPTKKAPSSPLRTTDTSLSGEVRSYLARCGISSVVDVSYASSEVELIEMFVQLVRRTDPDFLIGYEVATLSWGYLVDRAAALDINLAKELSRMPNLPVGKQHLDTLSQSGRRPPDLRIPGRIILNVWRLLKHEVALNVYTYENLAFHVLHQRIPLFSFQSLTSWYEHRTKLYRHRVLEHYVRRCHDNYKLLHCFNLIARNSEFARLYGIEFVNVLARGTQYRVESMMLRLAKPANYIAVSPSVQQRARMAAPECVPLILEPESKFYTDPVVVLDFQSLYPSMVIAYNYCFSTCMGRVRNLALHGDFTFGTNPLNVPSHVLKRMEGHVHISPNGAVFVKPHIRRGIIPRMLEEILGTRIMVKNSMKLHKGSKALGKMLDARQLGLKMIANVTYGYTAANFSGRMPCVEIADSIVQKGRETLERAIQLVNSTPEWKARVVYGDTDSLFVLLRGASKEEAFRVGREITERVTAANPKPVKLKFEKVYLPCVLQTKKRYVGFMYESPEQTEPQFDAKGIETVRRDNCPAVAKVLEKSLRLLFSSRDLSLVKTYVQRQCSKLLDGHVSIQEYTFAKEYRGKSNYRPGACVPALELTRQSLAVDRCSEPRVGERVPYVIVYGSPGQPLIRLVRRPGDVVGNPSLRLNGVYYITKQILPVLDRVFSLMGVDVRQWYAELPRVFRVPAHVPQETSNKPKGTIGQYFATIHCPMCGQLTVEGVCGRCRGDPQKVAAVLSAQMGKAERMYHTIQQLCQDCVGSLDPAHSSACVSLDCPVYHRLHRAKQELASIDPLREQLQNTLKHTQTLW